MSNKNFKILVLCLIIGGGVFTGYFDGDYYCDTASDYEGTVWKECPGGCYIYYSGELGDRWTEKDEVAQCGLNSSVLKLVFDEEGNPAILYTLEGQAPLYRIAVFEDGNWRSPATFCAGGGRITDCSMTYHKGRLFIAFEEDFAAGYRDIVIFDWNDDYEINRKDKDRPDVDPIDIDEQIGSIRIYTRNSGSTEPEFFYSGDNLVLIWKDSPGELAVTEYNGIWMTPEYDGMD